MFEKSSFGQFVWLSNNRNKTNDTSYKYIIYVEDTENITNDEGQEASPVPTNHAIKSIKMSNQAKKYNGTIF